MEPRHPVCDEKMMAQVYAGTETPDRWRKWIIFLFLALLCHLALFPLKIDWTTPRPPPPVEIQNIDPKKLDSVRRQWKQKSLLLDPHPESDKAKEEPKDARYFSDRNIRVDKEQRARQTHIIPKPGGPRTQKKSAARARTQTPLLGNLGVPLHLNENAPPQKETSPQEMEEGGQQNLLEKNLPQGSENLLNAQESVFYSFYSRIYNAIAPVWASKYREALYRTPVKPGEYAAVVEVILDDLGRLKELRLLKSSGVAEFDRVIDDSWKKVGPFQNPPQGILETDGNVHMVWRFNMEVQEGAGIRLLPPERVY